MYNIALKKGLDKTVKYLNYNLKNSNSQTASKKIHLAVEESEKRKTKSDK
jgi:hypothetical protein